MATRRYSPAQVKITFGGILISGYAEGTFIEVERNEDRYTTQVGSLGEVTRTQNLNRTGKVTLTLMQHAPINALLQGFIDLDELGDTDPQDLSIKDLSNSMRCHADEAWITKAPKIERSKDSATIQWTFECAAIEITTAVDE